MQTANIFISWSMFLYRINCDKNWRRERDTTSSLPKRIIQNKLQTCKGITVQELRKIGTDTYFS